MNSLSRVAECSSVFFRLLIELQSWTKTVDTFLKLSQLDNNYNNSPKRAPLPSPPKAKLFVKSANNRSIKQHSSGGGGGEGKRGGGRWKRGS